MGGNLRKTPVFFGFDEICCGGVREAVFVFRFNFQDVKKESSEDGNEERWPSAAAIPGFESGGAAHHARLDRREYAGRKTRYLPRSFGHAFGCPGRCGREKEVAVLDGITRHDRDLGDQRTKTAAISPDIFCGPKAPPGGNLPYEFINTDRVKRNFSIPLPPSESGNTSSTGLRASEYIYPKWLVRTVYAGIVYLHTLTSVWETKTQRKVDNLLKPQREEAELNSAVFG
ncbi:hypothetical protein FB451DRAFT_1372586 [Mycena latifolia]|nr:hypothetical protein FB451DRAFT_1372586 [Mycena latifolia]